jgi:hypothetical protein
MTFDDFSGISIHLQRTQAIPEYAEAMRREAKLVE